MAYNDYQKALKLGEKAYKSCTSKGMYPYLPVLEDMLSQEKSKTQVKLGLVEIPIDLIAGTYSSGRTTAFSNDFMPLLDQHTEFASKWSNLYDSLVENGQRDPILAYEYMNRFYVVEGNKRVSVIKYMGGLTIEGTVIRLIPHRNDSKANKIYYEFLDFYAATKINYVLMNKEGGYEKLLRHIHPNESEPFTDEELTDFKVVFNNFRKFYIEAGGDKLSPAMGDALLTYFDIFGYEDIRKKESAEIKKDVNKLWSEFIMMSDETPLSMITTPTDESQKKSITKLIPSSQALKVAYVYFKDPSISGWSYWHELGREHIESVFEDKVITKSFYTTDSSDSELLESIIADGYKVIFTTSPVLNSISLKCAVLHPDVIILNCSLNSAFRHVRTYYLRIYEAKFIIGAVAGILTDKNSIGYIADYPIFGMPASVNAFALGVKLVNPRAKIYLDWSTKKGHDPLKFFEENGVDIISNRDITAPVQQSREFGLYGLSGDTSYNIAMPVWNWGVMYESLIRSVMNGAWKNDENANGKHGLNYYWGMPSDAIDVIFSQKLPSGTRQLIWMLKNQIASNTFTPFSGDITDQEGIVRNKAGHVMSYEEIINMNWLADNIVGEIPDVSTLDESCHELISQLGIKPDQF